MTTEEYFPVEALTTIFGFDAEEHMYEVARLRHTAPKTGIEITDVPINGRPTPCIKETAVADWLVMLLPGRVRDPALRADLERFQADVRAHEDARDPAGRARMCKQATSKLVSAWGGAVAKATRGRVS